MDQKTKISSLSPILFALITFSPCHLVVASAQEPSLPPPRDVPANKQEATKGLSLDEAIEILMRRNYDLRLKFQDIPKARADVLSAGLRNNPSIFFSADGIPYGNYSEQRPGETDYELTLIQPTDVSGKRRRRIQLAERAQRVIEALYQDAVRQEIDKLCTAYNDVLAADINVRAAKAELLLENEMVKTIRDLVRQGGVRPRSDLTQAVVNQNKAETVLRRAEAALLQSHRALALLLAMPAEQTDSLMVSGTIHDKGPLPPSVEDLIRLAIKIRPDLAAYRLNVNRAQAQVRRTQAERFEDVLLFYTPYQIQTFPGQQAQAAPGWESGALVALPVFDRKQGDLARANIEVSQTQTEVRAVEQQIINEVRQASTDYAVSRESVERYEREILPSVRAILETRQRSVASGVAGREVLLAAYKDYNAVVRQYEETLLRLRRDALKLNTAVGQRLLP
jgi:cobalt-zinc-cadmium efflux system outer membrane protein